LLLAVVVHQLAMEIMELVVAVLVACCQALAYSLPKTQHIQSQSVLAVRHRHKQMEQTVL
jgi:cell division protein FtsB